MLPTLCISALFINAFLCIKYCSCCYKENLDNILFCKNTISLDKHGLSVSMFFGELVKEWIINLYCYCTLYNTNFYTYKTHIFSISFNCFTSAKLIEICWKRKQRKLSMKFTAHKALDCPCPTFDDLSFISDDLWHCHPKVQERIEPPPVSDARHNFFYNEGDFEEENLLFKNHNKG